MRRLPVLAVLVLSSLAVGGCAADPSSPSPGAVSPTPDLRTAPVRTEDVVDAGAVLPVADRHAEGIVPCEAEVTDEHGTYTPICLAEDAPLRAENAADGLAVDEPFMRAAVRDTAEFFVDHVLDPETMWNDDEETWAGAQDAFDAFTGYEGEGVRAFQAGAGMRELTDIDGWRDDAGIEPAPRPDGTRVVVTEFAIDSIVPTYRGLGSTDGEAGVVVAMHAELVQPVVDRDGREYEVRGGVELTVTHLPSGRDLTLGGLAQVGRLVAGGPQALPVLEVAPTDPDGWVEHVREGVRFALPAGAVETTDTGIPPLTQEYVDGDRAFYVKSSDEPRDEFVASDDELSVRESTGGGWFALRGMANARLTVPGARYAAAEWGTESAGSCWVRIVVVVDVPADAGSDERVARFTVAWDTTPQDAERELREVAGTLAVVEPGDA